VNWRFASDYDYLPFDREIIAAKHLERALKDPAGHPEDLAEGIRELKQVLEVNPASAVAHANLGTAYRMMGFHSGAIRQHEEALRLDPELADTRASLEDSRRELALRGDRVGAEAIPRTPFEQAEALEVAGRVDRATELYEQIVARDPFHYNAVSNLAAIHLRRGEREKAVRILERGLERQPANFGLLFNLGYAEAQMGQHARARQAWERCLRLQPGNALVEEQLRSLPGTR